VLCFLCRTDRILKYYSDEFRLLRVKLWSPLCVRELWGLKKHLCPFHKIKTRVRKVIPNNHDTPAYGSPDYFAPEDRSRYPLDRKLGWPHSRCASNRIPVTQSVSWSLHWLSYFCSLNKDECPVRNIAAALSRTQHVNNCPLFIQGLKKLRPPTWDKDRRQSMQRYSSGQKGGIFWLWRLFLKRKLQPDTWQTNELHVVFLWKFGPLPQRQTPTK
jgi:hypothetical protein